MMESTRDEPRDHRIDDADAPFTHAAKYCQYLRRHYPRTWRWPH